MVFFVVSREQKGAPERGVGEFRVSGFELKHAKSPERETQNPKEFFGAHVAQLAEHVLGKDEVIGSIPIMGSKRS
jgi:hypothetical protein